MGRIARFVKPLLGDGAARHRRGRSARDPRARRGRSRVRGAAGTGAVGLRAAHDDELARLPRPVVRDGPPEGDDGGERDHRNVPGHPLARHGLRAPPPLHGRDRRRVPGLGDAARGDRLGQRVDRECRPRGGRRDPHRSARRADPDARRPRDRRGARGRRGDRGPPRALERRRSADVGRPARGRRARRRDRGRPAPGPLPRLVRQGQPRGRRAAVVHVAARRRRASPRCDLDLALDGVHGARLRRGEVRTLQRPPVHRPDHSDPARPLDGATRQARDQLLRAVRAVRAGARAGRLGRAARSVRRRGRRRHRGVRAQPALDDRRPPGADPARHRARHGPDARATSSRASSRSSSCSSTGRCPASRGIGRRSTGCGSADRPRIRAAASWGRPAGSRPSRCIQADRQQRRGPRLRLPGATR